MSKKRHGIWIYTYLYGWVFHWIDRPIKTNSKSKKQASKILAAINEANEIHEGRKKGKSFDQFLKESKPTHP